MFPLRLRATEGETRDEPPVDRLAIELRVPETRMLEIVNGRRGITADTALRLARYCNTTPKFWLNLQSSYDLRGGRPSGPLFVARA